MSVKEKTYHLKSILNLKSYMKIAIDDAVHTDADGNYLINVGYLRVSTDRQADQGFGLDIQEADILRYCKNNSFQNLVLFIDDGYTGTVMERPALSAITNYITAFNEGHSRIRINTFLVARIDRLGRTLLGTLQFIQDYIFCAKDSKNSKINRNREDINFISVQENYIRVEKDNPQSKFLLMLFASLAEFDRDQIVEKLKRGRIARVASGKWPGGGRPPFGYRYDRTKSTLEIIPEEAAIVREMFRLFIEEKWAPQKIAEQFGFCGDWAVTQILRRKTLTGCIVYDEKEYPGNHEAIIPLETWEAAQEELERRSVHRNTSINLLSGIVYCGECGAKMRYQLWGKNGRKLICYSQQNSKPRLVKNPDCDNERFWAEDVEQAVIAELFKMNYLGRPDQRFSTPSIDPVESLQKELLKARSRLNRLYNFDEENGSDDILKENILKCRNRISYLEAQIREENDKATIKRKLTKAMDILRTLESTWPHMNPEEKQTVVQELIDRIVLFKDGTIKVELKLQSFLEARHNADEEPEIS